VVAAGASVRTLRSETLRELPCVDEWSNECPRSLQRHRRTCNQDLSEAGMRHCRPSASEIPIAKQVLRSRWPGVPVYDDVRELTAERLAADGIERRHASQADSHAKTSAMLVMALELKENDPGSGLSTRASLASLRPQASSIVENVSALLDRGMGTVLGDLSRIGYDAEWSVVSACSVGAPRMCDDRVFIVAYPDSVYGRPRVWDSAPREYWTLQALDGPEGARARYRARLANPSALYGGADGLPYGRERNRAIGNAVAP
jgi:DNA (cytosine-5)-methyltransferase 1